MSGRRRVSFVLPSLNGGGAERAAVQVLNGLAADKWDRSMFLFERTGPYLADLDPSIALTSSPSPSRVERWQALRRFVKEGEPHVVVAFLSFATALSAARAAQTDDGIPRRCRLRMGSWLAPHCVHRHVTLDLFRSRLDRRDI
jgi:hypothetical protein